MPKGGMGGMPGGGIIPIGGMGIGGGPGGPDDDDPFGGGSRESIGMASSPWSYLHWSPLNKFFF